MPNGFTENKLPHNCNYLVLKSQYLANNCILEKNQENTYFLEHSTDTTAMKSFDDATSMTLWIAILATLLAWWYGKQSFKLTQQAFEQSIEQIKASISISSQNTAATLKSNQILIDHQILTQNNQFNFQKDQEIRNILIDLSTTFIQSGKKIFFILTKYTDQLHPKDWQNFVNYSSPHISLASKNNSEYLNTHLSINKEIENMLESLFKFSMVTKPDNPKVLNTLSYLQQATDLAVEQRNMHLYKDKDQHIEKLNNLDRMIQNSRITLIEVIQDKNCFL
ncbi:hypothetical protein EXE30_03940 [Acinetobacter halotolerans]|uniref:Uncharacterized protein n=1 Tax=Acinetobacter halotolerans TaxID=1752076 RepID=A0A4Q6XC38_9GAMM|nr:hypothetical protein [Acinetobacter halotolerans]RZF55962.1 hypothetical protein EXE30_03940 [Acinetobacter halotolerans]